MPDVLAHDTPIAGTLPVGWAALAAAVGAGVVAGVWFAFSVFVMQGLDRLAPSQAIEAMQAINRTAVRPGLMIALFATALVCLALGAWSALHLDDRRAPWLLAGSVLYLAGSVGVTVAGNVPLNDALARVRPEAAGAAQRWADYLGSWIALNHVRTATAVAATALLVVGLARD